MAQPPIFVLDREGWISVFESVVAMEASLETNDVEAGEYVALDATGRPLGLTVAEAEETGRWWSRRAATVRMGRAVAEPRPELLRQVLGEALASDEALDGLVARARSQRELRATRSVIYVLAALSDPELGGD